MAGALFVGLKTPSVEPEGNGCKHGDGCRLDAQDVAAERDGASSCPGGDLQFASRKTAGRANDNRKRGGHVFELVERLPDGHASGAKVAQQANAVGQQPEKFRKFHRVPHLRHTRAPALPGGVLGLAPPSLNSSACSPDLETLKPFAQERQKCSDAQLRRLLHDQIAPFCSRRCESQGQRCNRRGGGPQQAQDLHLAPVRVRPGHPRHELVTPFGKNPYRIALRSAKNPGEMGALASRQSHSLTFLTASGKEKTGIWP